MGKHRWSALSTDKTKHPVTRVPCATMAWFRNIHTWMINHYYGFGFSFMGTMISGNSKLILNSQQELDVNILSHWFPPQPSTRSSCTSREFRKYLSLLPVSLRQPVVDLQVLHEMHNRSMQGKRNLRFSWRTSDFWVHVRFEIQLHMPCHVHISSDNHLVSFFQYFWVHSTWRSAQVLWVIS